MDKPIQVKGFKQGFRAIQWWLLGALFLTALVLGYIGFWRYFQFLGDVRSPLDIGYLTLQLFVLESGDVSGFVPWELEVARILAPAVASYALAKGIAAVFHEQLQSIRARMSKEHAIVCGLGNKGLLLARSFLQRKYRVVVIELNQENAGTEEMKESGAIVLIGNAADRAVLGKARVDRADYLVCACGKDNTNAEVAVAAQQISRSRSKSLTCFVHISDLQLIRFMREKALGEQSSVRLEYFNVLERGARALLNEHPTGGSMIVVGVGQLGEGLIAEAARRWRNEQDPGAKPLRVTTIDREAGAKSELLKVRYPGLIKVCEITPLEMDTSSGQFEKADFLAPGSNVYICLDDDPAGLSAGLALLRATGDREFLIVVGMSTSRPGGMHPNLRVFGLLDQACRLDILLKGTNEILAQAIHEDYVRKQKEKGETPGSNPSMVEWDDLPGHLRESNRSQADGIGEKLKAAGYRIAPLTDWDAPLTECSREEIESLARLEHDRWVDERKSAGWTYAAGPKNVEKKTSPYLLPYNGLTEEIKELDRDTVRELPVFLSRVGFTIERLSPKRG